MMTPSRRSLLSIGTASVERIGSTWRAPYVYSGSAWASGLCIVRGSGAARAELLCRSGGDGVSFYELSELRRCVVGRREPQELPVEPIDERTSRIHHASRRCGSSLAARG